MNDDEITDVLDVLTNRALGIQMGEPGHVTQFKAFLGNETVTVEIKDHGPHFQHPEYRYFCVATMRDGRTAAGNGGATAREALEMVHWNELLSTDGQADEQSPVAMTLQALGELHQDLAAVAKWVYEVTRHQPPERIRKILERAEAKQLNDERIAAREGEVEQRTAERGSGNPSPETA